jgi:hypothetical protein
VRFVTHLDLDDEAVAAAGDIVAGVIERLLAGSPASATR